MAKLRLYRTRTPTYEELLELVDDLLTRHLFVPQDEGIIAEASKIMGTDHDRLYGADHNQGEEK